MSQKPDTPESEAVAPEELEASRESEETSEAAVEASDVQSPGDAGEGSEVQTSDEGDEALDDDEELSGSSRTRRRKRRLFRVPGRFGRKRREGQPRRRYRPNPPTDFRRELTTIPNILTYIRMLMLPLILLVLDRENRWSSFLAGAAFSFACFTDFFDGYFARKYNQITVLGKLLDPLADKLLVAATLIVMIPMGRVPSWLVIVLLAREFAITGLRGIAASEGMVIASAPLAKYKTAFQMLAIFCLLIHYPYNIDYFGLVSLQANFHRIGIVFLYISLFFSLTSAADYFWKFAMAVDRRYKEALGEGD